MTLTLDNPNIREFLIQNDKTGFQQPILFDSLESAHEESPKIFEQIFNDEYLSKLVIRHSEMLDWLILLNDHEMLDRISLLIKENSELNHYACDDLCDMLTTLKRINPFRILSIFNNKHMANLVIHDPELLATLTLNHITNISNIPEDIIRNPRFMDASKLADDKFAAIAYLLQDYDCRHFLYENPEAIKLLTQKSPQEICTLEAILSEEDVRRIMRKQKQRTQQSIQTQRIKARTACRESEQIRLNASQGIDDDAEFNEEHTELCRDMINRAAATTINNIEETLARNILELKEQELEKLQEILSQTPETFSCWHLTQKAHEQRELLEQDLETLEIKDNQAYHNSWIVWRLQQEYHTPLLPKTKQAAHAAIHSRINRGSLTNDQKEILFQLIRHGQYQDRETFIEQAGINNRVTPKPEPEDFLVRVKAIFETEFRALENPETFSAHIPIVLNSMLKRLIDETGHTSPRNLDRVVVEETFDRIWNKSPDERSYTDLPHLTSYADMQALEERHRSVSRAEKILAERLQASQQKDSNKRK